MEGSFYSSFELLILEKSRGLDGGCCTHPGGCDHLAVKGIRNLPGGEYPRNAGLHARIHFQVTMIIQGKLSGEEADIRRVTDEHEYTIEGELTLITGFYVLHPQGVNLFFPFNFQGNCIH